MQNLQYQNVGNLGDIYKHAALVSLAKLLRSRSRDTTTNYLDTHAFVRMAPICGADQWRRDIAKLMEERPAYQAYRDIEAPEVDQGGYLCSTGLALEVLGHPVLYLSESNPVTLWKLENQLRDKRVVPKRLLKAVEEFKDTDLAGQAGSLLALFDPFKIGEAEQRVWETVRAMVTELTGKGKDGSVLTFQWGHGEPLHLPPPAGYVGLVTRLSDSPYHLLAYATEGICRKVTAGLAVLGWHLLI